MSEHAGQLNEKAMQSFVLLAIRTAEAIKKSRRRTGLSDLHAAPYNLFKLFAHYGGGGGQQ